MTRQKSDQALDLALDLREENKRMTQEIKDLREMVPGLNTLVGEMEEQMDDLISRYPPPINYSEVDKEKQ